VHSLKTVCDVIRGESLTPGFPLARTPRFGDRLNRSIHKMKEESCE
jgi:hypothetical protein